MAIKGIAVILMQLAVAGLAMAAIKRVKRQEDILGSVLDNAKNMVNDAAKNMGELGSDLANSMDNLGQSVGGSMKNVLGNNVGDLTNQAQKLADLVLKNTGFDPKDLPQDLMQTAGMLFQLTATPVFSNIMNRIKNKTGSNASPEDMKKQFETLLTDANFVREAKELKEKHSDVNSPTFTNSMEGLVQKYFMNMDSGAGPLVSFVCYLSIAFLLHLLF